MSSSKKTQDAAEVAQQAAEDMAREDGIGPLVGLPGIAGAVRRALENAGGDVPPELIATEEIRASVWAQKKVVPLMSSLGDLMREHPDLAGLSPAQRATLVLNPKHAAGEALRLLVREEIMNRVGQLVRAELARITGKGGE
jgi:hypothetical protein